MTLTVVPSTPGEPERRRRDDFAAFRGAVAQSFVPLQVSTGDEPGFHGTIGAARVGDISVTDIRASAHVVERTPQLVARGGGGQIKLSLMVRGSGLLVQDGRKAHLLPGTLAVYDTNRPYRLSFEDPFHSMVVMFPHRLLGLPPEIVSRVTGTSLDASDGLGEVVRSYLMRLADNLDLLEGPTGVRLAHSAVDLVATLFSREGDEDAVGGDDRVRLMRRVREHIEDHLGDPHLTPASIAAAHFISLRRLHALFQTDGTTVSTWVRGRRLERAYRDLRDPLLAQRSVSAIGGRWGFVDSAHFSRAFKAEFGLSPSAARAL